MNKIGGNVAKRKQDKRALGELQMRHDEARFIHALCAVEQEVNIYDARAETLCFHSPAIFLNFFYKIQYFARAHFCLPTARDVQEFWLIFKILRLGFVYRRHLLNNNSRREFFYSRA